MGPGEAAKVQLRKEGVEEVDALRAQVKAKTKIRERELQAGALVPWALSNSLRTTHLPTKWHQGMLAVEGTSETIRSDLPPPPMLEKRKLRSPEGGSDFPMVTEQSPALSPGPSATFGKDQDSCPCPAYPHPPCCL